MNRTLSHLPGLKIVLGAFSIVPPIYFFAKNFPIFIKMKLASVQNYFFFLLLLVWNGVLLEEPLYCYVKGPSSVCLFWAVRTSYWEGGRKRLCGFEEGIENFNTTPVHKCKSYARIAYKNAFCCFLLHFTHKFLFSFFFLQIFLRWFRDLMMQFNNGRAARPIIRILNILNGYFFLYMYIYLQTKQIKISIKNKYNIKKKICSWNSNWNGFIN